ncbi:MAG: hypothetical protein PG978_000713 [Wolbachia endosymbiont of Ctenocephalides felis wCfeF]|nr:MAG: hypothetical protein PG978_000713 [Wolbachia endosymbiont of Ctenocephalides felis wCfeF]
MTSTKPTLSIKIGAILDGSFSSTMTGGSAQLSRLGSTIRQLDTSIKSVSKFKELSRDTLVAKRSWKGLEVQVKSLAQQIKATAKPSKDLKAEFDKAKKSVIKAKKEYLQKRNTLHTFSEEVKKSGKNIQSLIRDQDKLGASVSKLRSQYNLLNKATQAHQRFATHRAHFKSQLLETAALALTFAAPVKAMIDLESPIADIKAVIQFSKNKEENEKAFIELGRMLKELSRTIPLSVAELAQITTGGARLAIKDKDDLIKFTEIVAQMAVNFGMSVEAIVGDVSSFYNIYKMNLEDLRDLGDLVNHLASNTSVDPKDLMAGINVASGAGRQFGLKIEQLAGFINAFVMLGKQPKKAAGVIADILVKLQTAEEQDDEFIETLEELGIDIEGLAENIKKKPYETLLDFFEILKKYGSPDILFKLFGSASKDIALLLEDTKAYGQVLDLLANKKDRANSLQEEFNDRVSTTANQLRLLRNAIAEVGMNLGAAMLPILRPIVEKLKLVSKYIASFAEEYPTITKAIMYTIGALISLKVLFVSGGYVLSLFMGTAWLLAAKVIATFSILSTSVLPAVATGFRVLTAAIASNPIGAIIAVIATGATLIITNWQKVKNFFASFWEYIKSIIKPIGEMFSWMGSTVGSIFGKVGENSPLKEFEKRKSIVAEIHTPLKDSISNNENSLLNNSAIKELSERSKNNVKIKSFIEEKKSIENNKVEKVVEKNSFEKKESKTCNQTFNQTFNVIVKAEPSEDTNSIANAVIEKLREQARGALFDIVEEAN